MGDFEAYLKMELGEGECEYYDEEEYGEEGEEAQ